MIARYTSLSGNIAAHVISIFHRLLQKNFKNESIHIIVIHPYNLVTATRKKSCSVRKCMFHVTNRRCSVRLHLVVLTGFPRWYYKKLHVISTRKILLKTILTMRFLVTVPRNFSQCMRPHGRFAHCKCVNRPFWPLVSKYTISDVTFNYFPSDSRKVSRIETDVLTPVNSTPYD